MLRIPQASRWLAVIALPLQAAILYLLDEKLDANWYGLRRKLSPPHVGTTGIYWIGMEGCKRSVSPREWAKSRLGKQSSRLFQDCAASKIKGMTFIRLLVLQKIFSHAWYRIEIKWRRITFFASRVIKMTDRVGEHVCSRLEQLLILKERYNQASIFRTLICLISQQRIISPPY